MKSPRVHVSIIALVIGLAQPAPAFGQITTATVTGGKIKGTRDNDLSIFRGIPFAAPPVGDLRWKAPQPVTPWTGVKEVTAFGKSPMGNPDGAEDCLYLNVVSPAQSPAEKLPVMVWIYGGSFSSGTGSNPSHNGAKLARKGVVYVSINYRLGAFGYLAHPELSKESGKGSGCYGIMDQIAGLQWVHDNIAQFGGDPGKVTVFGESAGGIAVSMLTVAPAAKGLFQRAISQSGGSMAPNRRGSEAGVNVPTLALAEKAGEEFFKRLGVSDLQAARALPAAAIQSGGTTPVPAGGAVAGDAGRGNAGGAPAVRFWPVADGATIPGDQYELFEAGKFHDVDILVGTNSDEGATFGRGGATPAAGFAQLVRDRYGPAADAILAVYPHDTDAEASQSVKDLFRESGFAWHTWAWAHLQTLKGKGKAYVYYFQYHTSGAGATHGADVGYVFGTRRPGNETESAISDLFIAYWTNFAKNGDPNGPGLPNWPLYRDSNPKAMIIDATSAAAPYPNLDKIKAFDSYYVWRRGEAKVNQK